MHSATATARDLAAPPATPKEILNEENGADSRWPHPARAGGSRSRRVGGVGAVFGPPAIGVLGVCDRGGGPGCSRVRCLATPPAVAAGLVCRCLARLSGPLERRPTLQRSQLATGRGGAAVCHLRRRASDDPQHSQLRLSDRDRGAAARSPRAGLGWRSIPPLDCMSGRTRDRETSLPGTRAASSPSAAAVSSRSRRLPARAVGSPSR